MGLLKISAVRHWLIIWPSVASKVRKNHLHSINKKLSFSFVAFKFENFAGGARGNLEKDGVFTIYCICMLLYLVLLPIHVNKKLATLKK
jgi:hypothetical protein